MSTRDWVTTGEAARALGVSRQHVVDLCERGALRFERVASHRRIRRSELHRLSGSELTREQEKSLWLHRALLGQLMTDPAGVLDAARENIGRWTSAHREDGLSARYLKRWEQIIDAGVDGVVDVLTGTDAESIELRQNSPFAGALTERDRLLVLRSFREHRQREHAVA